MAHTRLKKGKFIGAASHKGFVETFNWMLSWIEHFSTGAGLSLTGATAGRPRLTLNLIDGNGIPLDEYPDDDTPCDITDGVGGGESLPSAFEPVYEGGVISGCENCIYCAGRTYVNCGNLTVSATSSSTGYLILTLTHPAVTFWGTSNAALSIESLPSNTTDTATKIPLFHVTAGVVDIDFRNIPTAVLAR